MAWNPFLYKNEDNKNLKDKINNILKAVLILIGLSSLTIHVLGGWIIDNFFGVEYIEVKNIIFLAILPSGLLLCKEILETGIKLSGKTRYISYSYFISVLVTIVFMILANDLDEILMASLLGSIIHILCSWYFSEKLYQLKYSKLHLSIFIGFIVFCFISFLA
ncbi:hypothetical protein [Aeromonas hydrophila]|nr:hypothetical protein [Aeromonas hydrophila]